MRIIRFMTSPEVIKKILEQLGLLEQPHAPLQEPLKVEITFDPSLLPADLEPSKRTPQGTGSVPLSPVSQVAHF
jgi:hypothetical protein